MNLAPCFSGNQSKAAEREDRPDAERRGKRLQPSTTEDPQSCQADELAGSLP